MNKKLDEREIEQVPGNKYKMKKKNQAQRCLEENIIPAPEIHDKENVDPLGENPTPLLLSRADSPVSSASGSSICLSSSGKNCDINVITLLTRINILTEHNIE